MGFQVGFILLQHQLSVPTRFASGSKMSSNSTSSFRGQLHSEDHQQSDYELRNDFKESRFKVKNILNPGMEVVKALALL
jgi:hypothetical protein